MQKSLKRQYYFMLLPAVALFCIFGLARELNLVGPGQFALPSIWHSVLFILTVASGIAGPVLIRTLFAHAMRKQTRVDAQTFLAFQRKLLWVSLITPYLAFTALACDFPKFYAGAMILTALYALYYTFPSSRRLDFDRRIFRVK